MNINTFSSINWQHIWVDVHTFFLKLSNNFKSSNSENTEKQWKKKRILKTDMKQCIEHAFSKSSSMSLHTITITHQLTFTSTCILNTMYTQFFIIIFINVSNSFIYASHNHETLCLFKLKWLLKCHKNGETNNSTLHK